MNYQIITYDEVEKTDNGLKHYKLIIKNEDKKIIGYRKENSTQHSNILLGKKISNEMIELIEFDIKNYTRNVLYGHIINNQTIYGTWKKLTKQDIDNLNTDDLQLPKYIQKEKSYNVNSILDITDELVSEDIFERENNKLKDKLSYSDKEAYQYIKRL